MQEATTTFTSAAGGTTKNTTVFEARAGDVLVAFAVAEDQPLGVEAIAGGGLDRVAAHIISATGFAEQSDFRDQLAYAAYGGYHEDVAPAGRYATGLTQPADQRFALVAVEVFGAAGP